MKQFKKVKNMLGYNVKTLIGFEMIYKLISVIVFVPFFLWMFQFITEFAGYHYLTFENIGSFLLNPVVILLLLFLLVLMTFYTILDISTIIVILDCSYHQKKIRIRDAFWVACQKSFRVFQRKNITLPFLVLFLIPFLNLGASSGFVSTISIPEFIMDYISHNQLLFVLYGLLILFLSFLLFRWLYVLHYFVLEDCNFKEARSKSKVLSKKSKVRDFFCILLVQIALTFFYLLFILLGIFLVTVIYKIFGSDLFGTFSITVIWLLIAISFFVIVLLATPISYASISVLYYSHKEKRHEDIVALPISSVESKKNSFRFRVCTFVILVLVLLSGSLFTYSVMNGKYDLKVEYVRSVQVTAHRGASVLYPENTMSSFQGALELGADWIELDVQQTKDNVLIVLHDTNLKRTTGVNKNTWEITYPEVSLLDAGSFFDKKFANERIPTLEEVILFAKENGMKLNIELKPTGKEKDFEKEVIDLIRQYEFEDSCVITSQVYSVLENVKKYDEDVKTVYVMSFAYGDILQLKDADTFSIEASSINPTLVRKLHHAGKEVYAWTVNTEENIRSMIDCGVDNIITDNISLAKDLIYSSKTSDLVEEYIRFVNRLLK